MSTHKLSFYAGRYPINNALFKGVLEIIDDNTVIMGTMKIDNVTYSQADNRYDFVYIINYHTNIGNIGIPSIVSFSPTGKGDQMTLIGSIGLRIGQQQIDSIPEGEFTSLTADSANTGEGKTVYYSTFNALIDPITKAEVTSMHYHVNSPESHIISNVPHTLYSQEFSNPTSVVQKLNIKNSESVTNTSQWSNAIGIHVGVKVEGLFGIPIVVNDKIEVSVDSSNSFTWGKLEAKPETFDLIISVRVPPHKTVKVNAISINSKITVPFTMTGEFTYKSGYKASGIVNGNYTGTNFSQPAIHFGEVDPLTKNFV